MAKIVLEGVVTPGSIARLEFAEADVSQVLEALASLGFRRGVGGPASLMVTMPTGASPEIAAAMLEALPSVEKKDPPKPPKEEKAPKEEKKGQPLQLVAPTDPELPLDAPKEPKEEKKPPKEEKAAKEEKKPPKEEKEKPKEDEEKPKPSAGDYDVKKALDLKRLRDVVEYLIECGIKEPDAVVAACKELAEQHNHKPLQRTPDMEKRAKALAEAASVEE